MDALTRICEDKKTHIQSQKAKVSLSNLEEIIQSQMSPRGFIDALKKNDPNRIAVIAEIKKASPSKGVIREDFDPEEIASIYEDNGACCLSVLTDTPYFQGSDIIFQNVRRTTNLPLLRKDFMLDPYQIYESRALGADCILLIMAALSDSQAQELYNVANALGMDTLFETHDGQEIERAMKLDPVMVGVNNRNLKTLDVSLQTGIDLASLIPDTVLKVGESGIDNKNDIKALQNAGYQAFLMGERFMKEQDIAYAMKSLLDTNPEL